MHLNTTIHLENLSVLKSFSNQWGVDGTEILSYSVFTVEALAETKMDKLPNFLL